MKSSAALQVSSLLRWDRKAVDHLQENPWRGYCDPTSAVP